MKRIFLIVALMAAAVVGSSWYMHRSGIRAMNRGDVFVREQPEDKPDSEASSTASAIQPAETQELATHRSETLGGSPQSTRTPEIPPTPASDTMPRNPPNGMTVAGAGRYQLYRQGDITWRLNTETGQACVLLATENQWRKMLVYQHGCGGG